MRSSPVPGGTKGKAWAKRPGKATGLSIIRGRRESLPLFTSGTKAAEIITLTSLNLHQAYYKSELGSQPTHAEQKGKIRQHLFNLRSPRN